MERERESNKDLINLRVQVLATKSLRCRILSQPLIFGIEVLVVEGSCYLVKVNVKDGHVTVSGSENFNCAKTTVTSQVVK